MIEVTKPTTKEQKKEFVASVSRKSKRGNHCEVVDYDTEVAKYSKINSQKS